MRITSFKDNERTYLTTTDMENIFNVYVDKHGNYVYNLNSSLYFKFDDSLIDSYSITHDMHWTLISYKLYRTTRLAWVLMKLNNVQAKDVFKKKHAGDVIKYIPLKTIENILEKLITEELEES